MSCGSSMLANNSTGTPSSVAAGVDFRRRSFFFEFVLRLAKLVLRQHDRIGVDDQHALDAVHNQQVAFADHVARVVQADNRGDVQAAREDRGMRGHAADVGHKSAEGVLLEEQHVRRRQVVRHDDELLFLGEIMLHRARPAEQRLQHPLHDLRDVGLAFLQVRIVDLVELRDEGLHLLDQRPLRVAAPLEDEGLGY